MWLVMFFFSFTDRSQLQDLRLLQQIYKVYIDHSSMVNEFSNAWPTDPWDPWDPFFSAASLQLKRPYLLGDFREFKQF